MKAISDAVHAAGGSSIATAPTSTPSSARCARATSASMRCTSTCTRPSPPRTAAAARVRGRWSVRSAGAVRAAAVRARRCRRQLPSWSRRKAPPRCTAELRPDDRVPRPDGHVHPRARLYPEPRRRRASQVAEDAVLNANYMLRSSRTCSTRRSRKSGPCMHEALFSDNAASPAGFHARPRQGADRRGLPPDDDVFPAGGPRRDAGRADRDRSKAALDQFIAAMRSSPNARGRATRACTSAPLYRPRGGSTRRWLRGSRC
jgi:hypothetical protein